MRLKGFNEVHRVGGVGCIRLKMSSIVSVESIGAIIDRKEVFVDGCILLLCNGKNIHVTESSFQIYEMIEYADESWDEYLQRMEKKSSNDSLRKKAVKPSHKAIKSINPKS